MKILTVLTGALIIAGCAQGDASADRAGEDERDIAMVERMNQIPAKPIEPEPLTHAVSEAHDLSGAGCDFVPEGQSDPVLIALGGRAYFKLEDEMVVLTGDTAAQSMPYGGWSRYVGLTNWLEFSRDSSAQTAASEESWTAPGQLVIHDAKERVVYRASGAVECGA